MTPTVWFIAQSTLRYLANGKNTFVLRAFLFTDDKREKSGEI